MSELRLDQKDILVGIKMKRNVISDQVIEKVFESEQNINGFRGLKTMSIKLCLC